MGFLRGLAALASRVGAVFAAQPASDAAFAEAVAREPQGPPTDPEDEAMEDFSARSDAALDARTGLR